MMEYQGYTGQITAVDEAQGLIHGNVADINDVVTFEGKTLEELVQAFHDSVDYYLTWCEECAEAPEKPFSGKFLVRIAPDLHRRASLAAKKCGVSLNAWVASAMQAQIEKERTTRKRRTDGAEQEDVNTLLGLLELRLVRELRERREEARTTGGRADRAADPSLPRAAGDTGCGPGGPLGDEHEATQ